MESISVLTTNRPFVTQPDQSEVPGGNDVHIGGDLLSFSLPVLYFIS